MDRITWRKERRLWNEVQMDTIYAQQYDEQWGASINASHRRMTERLLDLCPAGSHILDAACGTGKYWPVVLRNFAQALHAGGYLYFTVEMESEENLRIAYEAGKRLELPLVYGEYAHHGGYHYYPTDGQVRNWLAEASFTVLDMTEGDEYRHYLTRK